MWILIIAGKAITASVSGLNESTDLRYGVSTSANHDDPHLEKNATQIPVITWNKRIVKTNISILVVTFLMRATWKRLAISNINPVMVIRAKEKAVNSRI